MAGNGHLWRSGSVIWASWQHPDHYPIWDHVPRWDDVHHWQDNAYGGSNR